MPQTLDILFSNALVLTMDRDLTQYFPGAVAVKGDSIVAVGYEDEIKKEYSARESIDCDGKVLMPGLINAHTHVPMTLLRGLADDLRLDVWLMGYMLPVEREFVSPEFVRLGTLLACAEQIRSGVTPFNGMYFFAPAIAPHAPYSTTPEILRTCADIAKEFDVPLHIHISETAFEVETMRKEQGMPVVPYVKKQGVLDAEVAARDG